jgi:hypothetical protein
MIKHIDNLDARMPVPTGIFVARVVVPFYPMGRAR